MSPSAETLLLIAAMGVISLGSRMLGYVAMRRVASGGLMERCLAALPGAVILSILTPVAVSGDWGARLALLVVPLAVLWRAGTIAAVGAGVAVAAITRALA
jgi:uncharacterized membrane protein